MSILELAGTNKNYRGLYQSVRDARPVAPRELDLLQVDFQETVEVPPLAEAMVALEHTHDHLMFIVQSNWRAPEEHSDLEPVHEALLLREHFSELLRTPAVEAEPVDFNQMLRESESSAMSLENALANWKPASRNDPFRWPAEVFFIEAARHDFAAIEQRCVVVSIQCSIS